MRCVITSLIAMLLVSGVGCSTESNGAPPSGGTVSAGSTATGPVKPKGPFKRGQVTAKTRVTTSGPTVTVLQPTRGEILDADHVLVRVEAKDPDGVKSVEIAGQPATSAGGDEYEATVPLQPGSNVVSCLAVDGKGYKGRAQFQVVRGATRASGTVVDGAIGANLSPAALAFASTTVNGLTQNLNLLPVLQKKDPLWEGFGAKARVVSMTHKPLALSLAGDPQGARVSAKIDTLEVGVEIELLGANLGVVTIFADRLTLDATAVFDPRAIRPGNSLGLSVQSPLATFDNFRLGATSGLITTVLGWASGPIEKAVKDAIEKAVVDELPKHLAALKIPGVDAPVTLPITVPGLGPTPLDLRVVPERAAGDPQRGLDLGAGLSLAPGVPSAAAWTRGVLATGTKAPSGNAGGALTVALSQDAANVFLDAMGRTGALQFKMDWSTMGPTSAFQPQVKMLYPFFKPVQELAPDKNTPFEVVAVAMAAPLVELVKGKLRVIAGEVDLAIRIDYMDGGPPLELMGLRVTVEMEAALDVDGSALRIQHLACSRFASDLVRETACELADDEIEPFLDQIVPKMLQQYKLTLPPIPIPGLPLGIVLKKPGLSVEDGFVLAWGDI